MQLEKTFNDFSKLVDVLANDARIFRDSIAGKFFFTSVYFLFYFFRKKQYKRIMNYFTKTLKCSSLV